MWLYVPGTAVALWSWVVFEERGVPGVTDRK
jgi:hypothetical protein